MSRSAVAVAVIILLAQCCPLAHAAILWNDPGPQLVSETGPGTNILSGKISRDDQASDNLYFKFQVDPLSDGTTEEYFAAFQLFENDQERLAVGNSLKAWSYSAFNTLETGENNKVAGDVDLRSARPEVYGVGNVLRYELPRRGIHCTIVFKVRFVPGGDDIVTVWMNPDLTKNASEASQPESLTTHFKARAAFNQIRLRHGGLGGGWIFSDMAVATSFNDFVVTRFWQQWWFTGLATLLLLAAVGTVVRLIEQRKYQFQLRRAEQNHALERERARIAQDLHDELGSLLTRISLLGGLLHTDKGNHEQMSAHASKISQAADQTVRALEEIVWAVRPGSDTLQSLVDYIAHFASELFEGNRIRCRLDLPHDLPTRNLPPDVRHNIFLIVKESLNNVLKHAGGSVVHLQVTADDQQLKIAIADDGKGFDPNATATNTEHNGLENMRRRATAVGGELAVNSESGKGTRMVFQVNFTS